MKFNNVNTLIVKVVAFATAFTVLYDLIKDLGEIATHVFHFLSMILGSVIFYKHKK
jgi:uncharacterized membrane protein